MFVILYFVIAVWFLFPCFYLFRSSVFISLCIDFVIALFI